jgi:hypothetical protein
MRSKAFAVDFRSSGYSTAWPGVTTVRIPAEASTTTVVVSPGITSTSPAQIRICRLKEFVHGVGLLFTDATALLGATYLRGDISRAGVQPTSKRRMTDQSRSLARQIAENRLGRVLSRRNIAIDLPQRGRIDQVNVTLHQRGEVRLGPILRIAAE